ncbi:hypothetical protein HanRHA438_Chr02g0067541 [Helianthus annuus]|nr:hypothetical protein HanRHA438_Chr02g0067541 [Helianthus annuus]
MIPSFCNCFLTDNQSWSLKQINVYALDAQPWLDMILYDERAMKLRHCLCLCALEPRKSALEDDFEEKEEDEQLMDIDVGGHEKV